MIIKMSEQYDAVLCLLYSLNRLDVVGFDLYSDVEEHFTDIHAEDWEECDRCEQRGWEQCECCPGCEYHYERCQCESEEDE